MKKIGDFFLSESTPRWQILLGGLFVIGVGFLQSEYYHQRTVEDTEVSVQQQRIDAKILEIQQNSIDFQTFANSYITAILDPGLFTEACSAFGFLGVRGPGRPLSGALSRIW